MRILNRLATDLVHHNQVPNELCEGANAMSLVPRTNAFLNFERQREPVDRFAELSQKVGMPAARELRLVSHEAPETFRSAYAIAREAIQKMRTKRGGFLGRRRY